MRRDANTRPTKSINNFMLPGKLLRPPTPRHPSADRQTARRLSSGQRDNQSPTESHLVRGKADCVEGDLALPVKVRLNVGIVVAIFSEIGIRSAFRRDRVFVWMH